MFCGFRSRWTIPVLCARYSAEPDRGQQVLHRAEVEPIPHLQLFVQARAVQVLHHQVGLALRIDVEVEDRDDVRMAQLGAGAALAQEALAPHGRIGSGPPNDLDGDVVAKQRAVREIDLAHPAGGELAPNLVLPVEEGSFGKHRSPVYPVR